MGLAENKRKTNWGKDPNNTRWARNTGTVGQKILRSQGWEPGSFLGAKDAPHAQHFTSASASHVRVTLKDDTLGLGAKQGRGDECTGLSDFQLLLGRLNGKSEEVLAEEKQKIEQVQLTRYLKRKLGSMNFVRGGFLVGDSMQTSATAVPVDLAQVKAEDEKANVTIKVESLPETEGKERKRKRREEADQPTEDSTQEAKKSKGSEANQMIDSNSPVDEERVAKLQRKADRALRREAKAAKKQKKEDKKNARSQKETVIKVVEVAPAVTAPAPVPATGASANRHLSRSRYIAQKQRAVMDPQALKQIFMIKT